MTHDDLTEMLRNLPAPSIGGVPLGGVQMAAANRLDHYRELLERAMLYLDADQEWQGEAALLVSIQEALK
jgi:hypothetical protein